MKDAGGRDVPLGTIGPREFSTGSLGWHLSTKVQIQVADCTVWCQVNMQVTIAGSKEIPPDPPEQPAEPAA